MEGLTRKRKWMMAVLALGVGALVMDRTLLGPPESASASDNSAPAEAAIDHASATGQAGQPTTTPQADSPADLSDFARRLAAMPAPRTESFTREDAFQPPADWTSAPLAGPPAVTQPTDRTALARAFHAAHTLSGTMIVDGPTPAHAGEAHNYIAIVDGKPCLVGTVLDDFRLIRIANRMCLWESIETGEQVVLRETN